MAFNFFAYWILAVAAPSSELSCSIRPVCLVVEEIIGDSFKLRQVIDASSNPHQVDLSTTEALSISASSGLIYIDPSFDAWVLGFENMARFPLNHDPSLTNFHIWLDPLLVADRVEALTRFLCKLKPSDCDQFNQRSMEFKTQLKYLNQEIQSLLSPLKGKTIIVTHNSFDFFGIRYSLNVESIFIGGHGQDPSAKRVLELVELIRRKSIPAVFYERQFSRAAVNSLIEASSVQAIELDPLASRKQIDSYQALLLYNVNQLLKGFQLGEN